jgi:hypothetical protein
LANPQDFHKSTMKFFKKKMSNCFVYKSFCI